MPPTLRTSRRLVPDEVEQVHRLVDAVGEADGHPPLSEHVMLHLPLGGDEDVRHLLVEDAGTLLGYAHLDVTDAVEGSSAELAVHPGHRRAGTGRLLVQELLAQSPDGRLRLWAHGEHPGAAALAAAFGFRRTRVLVQMRRPLGPDLPALSLPAGVRLRAFEVGRDEQAWTALNARAFSDHPEQGAWTVEEVLLREREPWFDPAGFLLAEDADGRLLGFHWTKVHGRSGAGTDHAHEAIGEVYVVGVDPAEQGRGLGPALTLAGLHHLRARGLEAVLLYVEEDNRTAVRVYERLGFTRYATDVCFSHA